MGLKYLRIRAGFTQQMLAMHAGIDPSYVSLIETGKRDLRDVGYDIVLALATALRVRPEQLFIGRVPPRPRRRQREAA